MILRRIGCPRDDGVNQIEVLVAGGGDRHCSCNGDRIFYASVRGIGGGCPDNQGVRPGHRPRFVKLVLRQGDTQNPLLGDARLPSSRADGVQHRARTQAEEDHADHQLDQCRPAVRSPHFHIIVFGHLGGLLDLFWGDFK